MKRSTNGLFGLSTASSAATILPSPIGLASAIASRREEIQMAINFFVANIAVVKMGGRYPAPFAAKATTAPGGGRCSRLIQKAMGWFRDPISSASSQRKDAHLASRKEPLASVGHHLRSDAQKTSYELAQTHSCVGTCGIVLNYPTGYEVGIIPALVRPGLVAYCTFLRGIPPGTPPGRGSAFGCALRAAEELIRWLDNTQ